MLKSLILVTMLSSAVGASVFKPHNEGYVGGDLGTNSNTLYNFGRLQFNYDISGNDYGAGYNNGYLFNVIGCTIDINCYFDVTKYRNQESSYDGWYVHLNSVKYSFNPDYTSMGGAYDVSFDTALSIDYRTIDYTDIVIDGYENELGFTYNENSVFDLYLLRDYTTITRNYGMDNFEFFYYNVNGVIINSIEYDIEYIYGSVRDYAEYNCLSPQLIDTFDNFLFNSNGFLDSSAIYSNGYNDGVRIGYGDGYAKGFLDGSNEDATITTIFNGIFGVALLPINMFLTMFNFDVMGINVAGIVTALLTVAVILIIIKFVTGKKVSGGE